MTPSTTLLPRLIADYSSAPPFVDKTYGEPLFHTESEVADLRYAPDDTLWSIEESGVLRQWSRDGRLLSRNFLTDLQTIWSFSPTAEFLASASDTLVIWDVATAQTRFQLTTKSFVPEDAGSWVLALAFSRDGSRIRDVSIMSPT